jgi:type I restriction enzyme S subunit
MTTVRNIEFSQIAADWKSAPLGRKEKPLLLLMRNGLTVEQHKENGELRVTRIETISAGKIDEDRVRFASGLSSEQVEKYRIRKNDILFSHINSDPHLGKTAIALKDYEDLLHGMNLLLLRANISLLEPQFLHFVCCYYRIKGVFVKICSRSVNQSSINQAKLKALEVPLPPLAEQRKIAGVLGLVQRALEQQERLIALTTELKNALLHQFFTQGLRGEPPKQTEIGCVPESWTATTLGELACKPSGFLQTGPFGSQLHKHEYLTEGVGVVNPTHLWGNRINHEDVPRVRPETAARLERHLLAAGDILFARRGEIGRHGMVTKDEEGWLCGTGCFLARVRQKHIDNRFLSYLFSTRSVIAWLNSHAAGAIMPNLNNTVLRSMPVFLPPKELQTEIADALDATEQKMAIHQRKHAALTTMSRTLLHQLMTAQIPVYALDPSELPEDV